MARPKGSADLLETAVGAHDIARTGLSLTKCAAHAVQCQFRLRWRNAADAEERRLCGSLFADARSKLGRARRQLVKLLLKGPWHTATEPTCGPRRESQNSCGARSESLSRDHVGRLMHSLRWSPQNPSGVRCSGMKKKSHAGTKGLPGKKNAARLGAHIVLPTNRLPLNSSCQNLGSARANSRASSSQGGGISLCHFRNFAEPQRHHLGLYYLLFFDNIAQDEVCVFLRALLRHLRGPSSFSWIFLHP